MQTTYFPSALREMGLSPYEVKCYLSLLQRNTLTVPEVAKLANIPRSSAYDALEKLMSRGMCTKKPGDIKMYAASDPASFEEKIIMEADEGAQIKLEDLHRKEKEIAEKTRATKENISKVIQQLRPQYEKSRIETSPLDYIEIIKDPYQMHKRFMQLVGQTREELLAFTKPPFSVSQEALERQLKQQLDMLRRGVRSRGVCEIPKDKEEREWLYRLCETHLKFGDRTRVIKELPMKMMIFDSRIVMLALEDPVCKQPSFTTQIVEHGSLAKGLKVLFETFWERAEDYDILKG